MSPASQAMRMHAINAERSSRTNSLRGESVVVVPVWCALLAAIHMLITGQVTIVAIGAYNLQTPELVLISFLPAFYQAVRHARLRYDLVTLVCCLYLAVWLLGLLRGVAINASQTIVSARANAVVPMFMLLALFRFSDQVVDGVMKAIQVAALLVAAILVLRLLFGPTLFYQISFKEIFEVNDGGRALSAQAALILAGGAVVSAARASSSALSGTARRLHRWGTAVFTSLLLLSFQGSATLAGAAGLLIIFAMAPGHHASARRLLVAFAAGSIGMLYVLAPELFATDTLISILPDEIREQVARRTVNFDTRSAVWSGFLRSFGTRDVTDQLFGLVSGARERIVVLQWEGVYWQHSLHSAYFGLLSAGGYFGLATFVAALSTIALVGVSDFLRGQEGLPYLAPALVGMLLVYGVGYDIRNEQGVFILLAAMVTTRPVKRETRVRSPADETAEGRRALSARRYFGR